jgi:transglutaminase-like putative cysteine protease
MNRIYFIIITGILISVCHAEKIVSDAELDSLINEDDAVVLADDITCRITDYNEAKINIYQKVLIKNKKGEGYCSRHLSESRFVSVDDIKARILDINGKEIKKLDDDDIEEASSFPGFVLYAENTAKYFRLTHNQYPYIFELSYEKEIESLFFWPDWYPQSNVPTKFSQYKLILGKNVPFKTFSIGLDIEPTKVVEGNDSVYIWRADNIPPKADEDFLPPEDEVQMAVLFAPENFMLDHSQGSFRTWDYVANWFWSLYESKTLLSQESKINIRKMVEGVENPYQKIRILYKYLQKHTRYVAISLGIGGWEPHDAESVFLNRYGDCKDLSTLMVAMLNEADIEAYPALALTRDKGITYPEFPSNQFNHCIVFVPLAHDTLWLECTADFRDIRDMPYTIQDINALVVKKSGGEIVRTPVAPASKNSWRSNSKIEVLKSGTTVISSKIVTSGEQKRFFRELSEYGDSEDEKNVLQRFLSSHVPNLKIDDYYFKEVGDSEKNISVEFEGLYKKAFSTSGSRIFINPSLFNRKTSSNLPDEEVAKRKYGIHFLYPYQDYDTVSVVMPFGYGLEAAPEPIEIENAFAKYRINYYVNDNFLSYTRFFEYKTNHFDKEIYGEFVEFLKTVIKLDQSKFVFKRGLALKNK